MGAFGLALAWLVFVLPSPGFAQEDQEDRLVGAESLGWVVGEAAAPVTVVEFSDVSCPYCADFHSGTRAALIEEYVPQGHVRWISLSYVSGLYRNSETVLVAAECAGRQDRYEDFLAAAYAERDTWLRAPERELPPVVAGFAADLGLDRDAFDACQGDPTVMKRLDAVAELAREAGVRGTPTWMVNGFPVMGALPIGYARQFIESQLEPGVH